MHQISANICVNLVRCRPVIGSSYLGALVFESLVSWPVFCIYEFGVHRHEMTFENKKFMELYMKLMTKLSSLLVVLGAVTTSSAYAAGEISYNVGFASEYYFRGILQKDSSASAGVDYENGCNCR